MRFLALLSLCFFPLAAQAQSPMTANAFEAATTGKTLTFSDGIRDYGGEQYKDGRRVLWSYLDGECMEGIWYPSGNMICFQYDGIDDPQCWEFFDTPGGLSAKLNGDGFELFETARSSEPLYCLGPKVGT